MCRLNYFQSKRFSLCSLTPSQQAVALRRHQIDINSGTFVAFRSRVFTSKPQPNEIRIGHAAFPESQVWFLHLNVIVDWWMLSEAVLTTSNPRLIVGCSIAADLGPKLP
jgi:hypothetical protein